MSTPVKVGLVIVLVAAVVGAGFLGTRVAAAQRATTVAAARPAPSSPSASSAPSAPPARRLPTTPGFRGPGRMPGFQGPNLGGQRGYGFGPMMPGFGGPRSPRSYRDNSRFPQGNARGPFVGGVLVRYRSQIDAAVASVLGMTTDELNAALAAGQSPLQIAQSKGMSQSDFRTKLADAMSPVFKQAVTDGSLTQAQADALLARISQGADLGPMGWRRGLRPGRGVWAYPWRR